MTPTPGVTTTDSDTLPVEQLDHLEELLAAATPGPWWFRDETHEQERHGGAFLSANVCEGMYDVASCSAGELHPSEGDRDQRARDNAALIAAAVTALPALLAMVRRQQAALDAVTELHIPAREPDPSGSVEWCEECSTTYPCRTAALASPAPTEATT